MSDGLQPLKWILNFFRWFCHPDYVEDIEGDLLEKFSKQRESTNSFRAHVWLLFNVLLLVRPGLTRAPFSMKKLKPTSMLRHNLLITFRGFQKYKTSFLINLIGLISGLTCFLVICLWISDELQIDRFHTNDDYIYQLHTNHNNVSGIYTKNGVPGLLGHAIQQSVPEVRSTSISSKTHEYTLTANEHSFKTLGKFATPSFLAVFSYPLITGNISEALSNKSNILITQKLALRLFGNEDVIGKQIQWHFWGKTTNLQVAGVLADLPSNSTDQFDFIMSWDYYEDDLISFKNWGNYYARIALLLSAEANPADVQTKVDQLLKANQENSQAHVILVKFSDLYLHGDFENGVQSGGRIEYVKIFSVIAILILLIACINFINLSTASASLKTKLIGIKKAMGASRMSLARQFLTESLIITVTALVLSIILVLFLLPHFNFITQKSLSVSISPMLVGIGVLFVLLVSVLSGVYPALYLSSLSALQTLKIKSKINSGHAWGRKLLVVIQFSLSILMIMGMIVIKGQLDYMQNKQLGFTKDHVIYMEREGNLLGNGDAFLDQLKELPSVEDAAVSGFMIGGSNSTSGLEWDGKAEGEQMKFWETSAGYGMIELLEIEVISGRSFDPTYGSDSSSIIINEAAARVMNMQTPIGKTLTHYSGQKKIIGVVKDFHLTSLHNKVEPAIFLFKPEKTYYVMAKLTADNLLLAIGEIQKIFESYNPGFPFDPQFLDQDFQAQYDSERRISSLSGYFAGLAILISCLGLFGLATFMTESRAKEIGIRKILGSNALGIVMLLTGNFTKMIGLAITFALPLGYYLGNEWLGNYAYSIEIKAWQMVAAAVSALVIAWITVASRTLKVAYDNPVDALRDE
ncbi:MAG: putative ABC transport system permease protein [Cyclobacteriaceae bacterium]|jgi:putative ABC transport system permease protein